MRSMAEKNNSIFSRVWSGVRRSASNTVVGADGSIFWFIKMCIQWVKDIISSINEMSAARASQREAQQIIDEADEEPRE